MKMKPTIGISILAILTGILMLGCKKHTNAIPAGMTSTINSTPSTLFVATYYSADTAGTTVSIGAVGGIYNMSIYIPGNKIGTYAVNYGGSGTVAQIIYTYSYNDFEAVSGNVTITRVTTNNIQGTFNCIFSNGWSVTNGQFNVPIQ